LKFSWYESRRVVVKVACCGFFGVALRAGTFNKYFNRSEDEPDQLRITSGLGKHSRIEFEGATVHTQHLPFDFLVFLRSIPACLARSRNALKFHNKLIQRQAAPRPAHKYFARPPRFISLSSSTTSHFFQPHQHQLFPSEKNSTSSKQLHLIIEMARTKQTARKYLPKYYCTCRVALHNQP
jgi:hypothetical protein